MVSEVPEGERGEGMSADFDTDADIIIERLDMIIDLLKDLIDLIYEDKK